MVPSDPISSYSHLCVSSPWVWAKTNDLPLINRAKWWDITNNIRLQKTDFYMACMLSWLSGLSLFVAVLWAAGRSGLRDWDHGTENGLWPTTTEELLSTKMTWVYPWRLVSATAELCDDCQHWLLEFFLVRDQEGGTAKLHWDAWPTETMRKNK